MELVNPNIREITIEKIAADIIKFKEINRFEAEQYALNIIETFEEQFHLDYKDKFFIEYKTYCHLIYDYNTMLLFAIETYFESFIKYIGCVGSFRREEKRIAPEKIGIEDYEEKYQSNTIYVRIHPIGLVLKPLTTGWTFPEKAKADSDKIKLNGMKPPKSAMSNAWDTNLIGVLLFAVVAFLAPGALTIIALSIALCIYISRCQSADGDRFKQGREEFANDLYKKSIINLGQYNKLKTAEHGRVAEDDTYCNLLDHSIMLYDYDVCEEYYQKAIQEECEAAGKKDLEDYYFGTNEH